MTNQFKKYFITAIGTGCGKTLISAIITEALEADYWKPIQSGIEESDKETVRSLISNSNSCIHDETFLLKTPVSPHQAAKIEGKEVNLDDFKLPKSNNKRLIIEGAGGILAPLNEKGDFVIDLALKFDAEVILISQNYLGSINHTILTLNELKRRNIPVLGIIFNGLPNPETESFILNYSKISLFFNIKNELTIDKKLVLSYKNKINTTFFRTNT